MITREIMAKATKTTTDVAKAILATGALGLRITASRIQDASNKLTSVARRLAKWIHGLRKLWLFLVEVIGVVLVTWGISFWSIPSAVIIGGLILVVVIELRPLPGPKFPEIPVPEAALRHEALYAAEAINNERFGLTMVDPNAFEKLTLDDCEKIITLARTVGAKRA